MIATYILGALAIVFLVLGLGSVARAGGAVDPRARTWLIIAIVFAAVTALLWTRSAA